MEKIRRGNFNFLTLYDINLLKLLDPISNIYNNIRTKRLTILAASSKSSHGKILIPLLAIKAFASSTFVPIYGKPNKNEDKNQLLCKIKHEYAFSASYSCSNCLTLSTHSEEHLCNIYVSILKYIFHSLVNRNFWRWRIFFPWELTQIVQISVKKNCGLWMDNKR